MRPAGVILDLDGTMVDSAPDLAHAVNRMLTELGRPTVLLAAARSWIGNGVRCLVERALSGDYYGCPEPLLVDKACSLFESFYRENLCQDSVLFPGVEQTLARFAAAGLPLACVTNKPGEFTQPLLAALGIAHHFASVVVGDNRRLHKPDPQPLLQAARQLTVPAGQCLVVGDSVNDLRAARAAGMTVVLVSYGYNQGADLHQLEADAVIDSIAEILQLVELTEK